MIETWRPVVGWLGWYEVSDGGSVRSVERTCHRRDGTVQTWAAREMRGSLNGKGYRVVRLSRPGQRVVARVHRLVAEAFLAPTHTTETVNHIDGVKTNNGVENLEWATRTENTHHSIANGLGDYVPPWRKRPLPDPPRDQQVEGSSSREAQPILPKPIEGRGP